MIKAIFFDIDGTLVSFKTHAVPASTIECIEELRKKGIKVFIATGRHISAINNLGTLQFDGYITINGGYCFVGNNDLIYKHSIAPEAVDSLIKYQEEVEQFPCIFVQEKELYLNYKNERVEEVLELLNFPQPPIRPLRDIPSNDVFQFIAFFGPNQEERIMKALPGCESTRWTDLFTDVVPSGGSKRIGIDKMIEYLGISLDETMAFGDGGNDIQMLKHVGIGVAMGNAEDEVKQVADYVTTSVDDNGICNALKHFNIL